MRIVIAYLSLLRVTRHDESRDIAADTVLLQ